MYNYLPLELILGILTSLPVKTLLRFRCVCKEWCCLISNPKFITNHLEHASSSSAYAFVRWHSENYRKPCYNVFDFENFTGKFTCLIPNYAERNSRIFSRVVGYCNGVFCLSYDHCMTIILWNPSIRRAINAPFPFPRYSYGGYRFVLGFGFDAKNSDYKVVRLNYHDDWIPSKVDVFSANSGKWRFVKSSTAFCIIGCFSSQAVLNGVVHWVGYVANETGREGRKSIVTFDMSSELFGELGLPKSLENVPARNIGVVMLMGSISLVNYASRIGECGTCAIWVMKEYGIVKSWVNPYNVSLEGGLKKVFDMPTIGEIVVSSSKGDLVLYNCESGRAESIGIHGMGLSFFMNNYVESLAFLSMGDKFEPDYEDENEFKCMKMRVSVSNIIRRTANKRPCYSPSVTSRVL